jgi:ADP-ribose pyrophosphatase
VAEGLTAGPTALEAGEDLQVHSVQWAKAMAWTRDGTIRDGKTLIGLLWWQQWCGTM